MDRTYRIDGTGGEAVFLEAGHLAEQAAIDMAGTSGTAGLSAWTGHILAVVGASAIVILIVSQVMEDPVLSPDNPILLLCFLGATGAYFAFLWLSNRAIGQTTARAYLSQPIMQSHHVILSAEGMRVVSGQTYTLFHWADVTRIEALPTLILVMAGMAWAYVPLDGFPDPETAKAALADMRTWQQAAQA